MELSAKQKQFVNEYVIDLNATQAAIRAGYSHKTAQMQSSRLLSKAMVKLYLAEVMAKREVRTFITQDRVLMELARIAFFDPRKLLNDDGSPKNLGDLDDDCAAVIAGVDVYREKASHDEGDEVSIESATVKYKLADKNGALTLAMRHLGMLNDKLQVDMSIGLAERMKAARERTRS